MGYYVRLEESTAVLPKKHQAEAYRRMCALNDNDERKQGGSWSDGQEEKWFSWMDPNYPDTCADAKAILADLGFWFDENEDGDLGVRGVRLQGGAGRLVHLHHRQPDDGLHGVVW